MRIWMHKVGTRGGPLGSYLDVFCCWHRIADNDGCRTDSTSKTTNLNQPIVFLRFRCWHRIADVSSPLRGVAGSAHDGPSPMRWLQQRGRRHPLRQPVALGSSSLCASAPKHGKHRRWLDRGRDFVLAPTRRGIRAIGARYEDAQRLAGASSEPTVAHTDSPRLCRVAGFRAGSYPRYVQSCRGATGVPSSRICGGIGWAQPK